MEKILDIDNVDLKIISLLNEDAKTPYTEIAKKVFVFFWNCPRTNEETRGHGRRKECHFNH